MSKEDLLQPTLSGYRQAPALYGSTGFALSAFFGGPVGAAVYALFNAGRLGRLWKDLPVIIGIAAVAFLALLELHEYGLLGQIAAYLGGSVERNFNIIVRAFGLASFGALYLLHRQFFRAARVTGAEPLSGWPPGITAVLAGFATNISFNRWVLEQN